MFSVASNAAHRPARSPFPIARQSEKTVPRNNVLAAAAAGASASDADVIMMEDEGEDEQGVDLADAALFQQRKPNNPTVSARWILVPHIAPPPHTHTLKLRSYMCPLRSRS